MKRYLVENNDWIVLNDTMQVLHEWSRDDPPLSSWLEPELERLTHDTRRSVAKCATKLLAAQRENG